MLWTLKNQGRHSHELDVEFGVRNVGEKVVWGQQLVHRRLRCPIHSAQLPRQPRLPRFLVTSRPLS
eukprot:3067323-Rhodomonas_salina.1